MPRVLVAYTDEHPVDIVRFRERIEAEVDTVEMPVENNDAQADVVIAALDGHDGLFVRSGHLPARVFDAAPALRMVALHGSGYDHVDLAAATEHGVIVTHNPEGPGPAVVEHTIGFMISLLRDLPRRFEQTAEGDWSAAREMLPELGRQTVGVIGLGTIGFPVAEALLDAFGAEVIGYDPYLTGERESPIWPRFSREQVETAGVELVGIDALFNRASIITIHTPLTSDTDGLVGRDLLERLDGGYVINVARGGVVDEPALAAALDEGDVIRAGLDVLTSEPPPADHPLLGRPDVYVTPHVASVTDGYLERAAEVGARKLTTGLTGGRPDYVVNPWVF